MEAVAKAASKNDNAVINSQTQNMVCTTSLNEQIKKAEKDLKNLINRKLSESVINPQRIVLEQLKQELAKEQNSKQESNYKSIAFQIAETGKIVSKQIAFVKNNRMINYKKVDEFIAIIANKKYENAYPIIVVEAKDLIRDGYIVTDTNGRELTEDEAENYYVILDGQHKVIAFAKLSLLNEEVTIPNVYIKKAKNVGEYLVNINTVGNWNRKDRVIVAALTSKDELFKNIAGLINEGFNPSTAGLIYAKKAIPEKAISNVLKGKKYQLPKEAIVDIQRGNKFITLCKSAHITVPFLTKRYFIKGFNSYAILKGDEQAFKALGELKGLGLTDEMLNQIKDDDNFLTMLNNTLKA